MKKYELIIIVDSQNTQEAKDNILKQVIDIVEKSEGKIINSQVWLEKQKFTFRIKKCAEGTYYIVNFEAGGDANSKIKQGLKINERVLRSAIFLAQ